MKRWLIPLAAICALLLAGEWFARSVLGLGDPPLSITHPRIEYLYLADVLQRELSPLRIPRHPASDSTRRRPRIPRDPGRLFQ